MASLTGNTIQSTYDSLLKVTDNDSITGSLKRITDGLGNNTPLYLSSSAVEIVSTLNVTSTITASNLSGTNTGDETKASIETKLGAATSSNSGYLTSTDWSTFNNKIAGTGTLNKLAKFSSSSSIADSTITDTGSAVTIGVATSVTGSLTASSLIKSGGTSAQILAADGSVITAGTNITISGGTISASGGISGSGTAGRVPRFITTSSLGDSNIYTAADETIGLMTGIGASPNGAPTPHILYVSGNSYLSGTLTVSSTITGNSFVKSGGTSAQILAANGSVITAGTNITISGGTISANNTSQWTTSGSNIYYNTGNVGIGTTSPSQRLTIGDGSGTGNQYVRINSSSSDIYIGQSGSGLFGLAANAAQNIAADNTSYPLAIGTIGPQPFILGTTNNERMRITSGGAVGIGTTNPNTQLHVAGSLTVNDVIYLQRASSSLLLPVMTYWNGSGSPLTGTKGDIVAIGNAGGDGLVFVNSNTERMRINGSGNVGIGTTSPATRLHLNGGTTGNGLFIQVNGSSNTFLGNVSSWTGTGTDVNTALISYNSLIIGTNDTERMRITSGGSVGIGTSSPNAGLEINTSGGNIFTAGTTTNGYKLNVFKISDSIAIENIKSGVGYRPLILAPYGGEVGIGTNGSTFAYIGGSTIYNTSRLSIEVSTDQSGITTNVNSSDTRYHLYFRNTLSTVGSISTNTYATSFNTSSDYRLKEDLKPFNGLSILKDIKVYDFKWKGVEDRNYGVVAHEIAEVIPYAVNGEKDGEMHQSVDYSKLVPILIQSIQELKAELEELKNK